MMTTAKTAKIKTSVHYVCILAPTLSSWALGQLLPHSVLYASVNIIVFHLKEYLFIFTVNDSWLCPKRIKSTYVNERCFVSLFRASYSVTLAVCEIKPTMGILSMQIKNMTGCKQEETTVPLLLGVMHWQPKDCTNAFLWSHREVLYAHSY